MSKHKEEEIEPEELSAKDEEAENEVEQELE